MARIIEEAQAMTDAEDARIEQSLRDMAPADAAHVYDVARNTRDEVKPKF